jgi:hypothetical protein
MSKAPHLVRHSGAVLHLAGALPADADDFLRKYEIESARSPSLLVAVEGEESMEDLGFKCHRRLASFMRHGLSLAGTTLSIGVLLSPAAAMQTVPLPMELMGMLDDKHVACEIVMYVTGD